MNDPTTLALVEQSLTGAIQMLHDSQVVQKIELEVGDLKIKVYKLNDAGKTVRIDLTGYAK